MMIWKAIQKPIARLLFPMDVTCISCKKDKPLSDHHLCDLCADELVALSGRVCQCCGHAIDLYRAGSICKSCITATYAFDTVRSCFEYSGVLRQMIHHMKYGDQTYYARYFSTYMVTLFRSLNWEVDGVLSVPAHQDKMWARGYNAADLITQFFCQQTGLENYSKLLVKTRATLPQATLTGQERRINLKGAFQSKADLSHLGSVMIIDDLFTTGSTMSELAKILKKSGVNTVYGLTLATGKRD